MTGALELQTFDKKSIICHILSHARRTPEGACVAAALKGLKKKKKKKTMKCFCQILFSNPCSPTFTGVDE